MGGASVDLTIIGSVLTSIALTATAQLTLKIGMSSDGVQRALGLGGIFRPALTILSSPVILLGLSCYVMSAAAWLYALARLDLAAAYPFTALTIMLTVLGGYFLLGEVITPRMLVGMLTIVVGVILVGTSIPESRHDVTAARIDHARG